MVSDPGHAADELFISYTLFPTVWPREKTERTDVPWSELVSKIRDAPTYIDKAHCPLVSLCAYGGLLSSSRNNPILRHAENVQRCYGIELDYDGEEISLERGAQLLHAAGLRSVLYTSPGHKETAPRWRALFPLSEPAIPEKRSEYVGRANRVLGGIASRESFTLSQSFYIGRVRGVEYRVLETNGRCIDLAADLEPLYYAGHESNGQYVKDSTTDAELRAAFDRGENRYTAMLKLSSRWAACGLGVDDIENCLYELLGTGSVNADGIDLRTRCRPLAESAVRKYGETRRAPDPLSSHGGTGLDESPPDYTPEELARFALGRGQTRAEKQKAAETTAPAFRPINWAALEGKEPPPREWIIPHWMPAGHITLLSGRGGVGKTLLAQHIGASLALGHEYLEALAPRRVLMLAAEDDEAELWRRQIQISGWMRRTLTELAENFALYSLVGQDITLVAPVFGALTATPMLERLRQMVGDLRAEVVILDNIARLYGCSENDRHAVTTFCALVQGACAPAAVLLLGHPAKAIGSEYSGSTAWEGAVRARLYLSDKPPDQQADAEDDAPINEAVRYLSRRKANYSARDIRKLDLLDGIFVPESAQIARILGRKPLGEMAKDTVRRAASKLASRDIFGTGSNASQLNLAKLARQYQLLETLSEKEFARAMREMILAGELVNREVGRYPNRTPRMGLIFVEPKNGGE